MKKAFLLVVILFISVISTACINNFAVQELNNKAKESLDKGDFENAIGRLKSSIDLDSTFFETHYNLGIAYTQDEKYTEAIKSFKNAIKLKPDFADTYYSLAVTQENYAKGLIDGSIKNETDKDGNENSVKSQGTNDEKTKILTKAQKTQIAQILNDSIINYGNYLEKAKKANDKREVKEKINYLKTQIDKYSTDNTKASE